MSEKFIEPTPDNVKAVFARGLKGPIVMLNLLRFRDVADYSGSPDLAPPKPMSGAEAYKIYMAHATPFVQKIGGQLVFAGEAGAALIGPTEEHWDSVILVRYPSLEDFMKFASDPEYQKGVGHRTAALAESRLVPMTQRGA
ncbi:DUF1330 domain-containing protein [Terricaulis sp.]|uniref:DUF1330 domain-containing protein n=1 Tax=Terricaulis sp. TaxID=2768686 RepID=UPI00378371BE